MNMKKLVLSLLVLLAFFSLQNIAFAGFGVSPASVVNRDLVPGSFYQQDIFLVQGTPDSDLNVTVTIDAPSISNWIKIENGNSFVIPKGTEQFPMNVSVSVPRDAKLGQYNGTITIKTSPAGKQADGVSAALGANIEVDLKVSSIKVSDFSIQNLVVSDLAKGGLVNLAIRVKNDGNVENGPTKADLTIFDQYHTKQLGQQEKMISEKINPFMTKDIVLEFPFDLDVGTYWADVNVYSGDKKIIDNNKIVFVVSSGSPVTAEASKTMSSGYSIYILLGLVLVFVIVLIMRRNTSVNTNQDVEQNKI